MQNQLVTELDQVVKAMLSLTNLTNECLSDFLNARVSRIVVVAPEMREALGAVSNSISLETHGTLDATDKIFALISACSAGMKKGKPNYTGKAFENPSIQQKSKPKLEERAKRLKQSETAVCLLKKLATPATRSLTATVIPNSELWWVNTFEIADSLRREVISLDDQIEQIESGNRDLVSRFAYEQEHRYLQKVARCQEAFLTRISCLLAMRDLQGFGKTVVHVEHSIETAKPPLQKVAAGNPAKRRKSDKPKRYRGPNVNKTEARKRRAAVADWKRWKAANPKVAKPMDRFCADETAVGRPIDPTTLTWYVNWVTKNPITKRPKRG